MKERHFHHLFLGGRHTLNFMKILGGHSVLLAPPNDTFLILHLFPLLDLDSYPKPRSLGSRHERFPSDKTVKLEKTTKVHGV